MTSQATMLAPVYPSLRCDCAVLSESQWWKSWISMLLGTGRKLRPVHPYLIEIPMKCQIVRESHADDPAPATPG